MQKGIVILALTLLMSGCVAPKYVVDPIPSDAQTTDITIVKDDATRAVFLDTMKDWCLDSSHKCQVVPDDTAPVDSELTLTYVSRWSWDVKSFVSDAKIKAYKNNQKVGEVEFKAPSTLNLDKFGNDEKRIESMLQLLFGQLAVEDAHDMIKSGDI